MYFQFSTVKGVRVVERLIPKTLVLKAQNCST